MFVSQNYYVQGQSGHHHLELEPAQLGILFTFTFTSEILEAS